MVNDFAASLHPDARDIQYKETRSFRQLSERLRKHYSRTGYVLAGGFFVLLVASETRNMLHPLIIHEPIYVDHDRATGWVGRAVAAHDAPATFGIKEAHSALSEYVWARERYIPEIEQINEARVKAMSSVPAFTDYTTWLNADSPKRRMGAAGGHIDVFNITFGEPLSSPDLTTFTYTIRYNRREIATNGSGADVTQTCDTTAAFQWHPEMIQDKAAADLNAWGLEVISYRQPVCK